MKYQYFISYIVNRKNNCQLGNVDIACSKKITNIRDIRWAELRLREEIKAEQAVILNYQLLKKYKER